MLKREDLGQDRPPIAVAANCASVQSDGDPPHDDSAWLVPVLRSPTGTHPEPLEANPSDITAKPKPDGSAEAEQRANPTKIE